MASFHVLVNDQSTGPFTEEQLREQLARGEVNAETMVWREGDPDWVKLGTIPLAKTKIGLRRPTADTPSPALSPTPPEPTPPLQFDKAEFAQQTAVAKTMTCASCQVPIADVYFTVDSAITCSRCHDSARAALTGAAGSGAGRFLRATAAGIGAAAVGSAIWYAIAKLLNMELGLIAIAVGLLVGFAVRWGSNGRGGWLYQTLAIVLTYCAIVSSYIPFFIEGFRSEKSKMMTQAGGTNTVSALSTNDVVGTATSAPKPPPEKTMIGYVVAIVILFVIAFISPFLQGVSNIIGLIIIGIALYEAWKINKRVVPAVSGPFRVGAPSAPS
jgi:hypothetical protein